jgi:hypothetical protein
VSAPQYAKRKNPDTGIEEWIKLGQHDLEMTPEEAKSYKPPDITDGRTFAEPLEEFHDWLATHGHAPGSPSVRPGSHEAMDIVRSQFAVSDDWKDRQKVRLKKASRQRADRVPKIGSVKRGASSGRGRQSRQRAP